MLDRAVAHIIVRSAPRTRMNLVLQLIGHRLPFAGIEAIDHDVDWRDPREYQEDPGKVLRRKVPHGNHGGYNSNRRMEDPVRTLADRIPSSFSVCGCPPPSIESR
jgi:hypothetical protein